MGTSGAFGGSGGKDAKNLRESIADWLTDKPASGPAQVAPLEGEGLRTETSGIPAPGVGLPQLGAIDLRSVIRFLNRGRDGGDGPSGGGAGGDVATRSGGRSSGGARRSLGATSKAAGRAGAIAYAYMAGDSAFLQFLGLNYHDLLGLSDMVAVGTKIVQAAFNAPANGTIEDDESRGIVAEIVGWILESPEEQTPTPDDIVRRSIEVIIAEVTLTEVGDRIRSEPSREKRRAIEQEIRDAAEVYASQVTLTNTGASEQEMAKAIEGGIRELGRIFGGDG